MRINRQDGDTLKRTRLDLQQDIIMFLLRPLVFIWMWIDAKRKVHRDPKFHFNRKEPYVMLANHTFLFDVVHVPLRLVKVPFIIASQTLFTKQPAKFLVTQVAHVIPKSKGRSDSGTIMKTYGAIKRGYPILIFPEGDSTFYGETGHIEEATMKLIKKLKLDVVTVEVSGGYLSNPRWATGVRKNRRIHLDYKLEIPKAELAELSLEEIGSRVHQALYHNDYEYQREHMIPHPGKKLAEGIENIVYVCPHCQSINSIVSHGNTFHCQSCGKEGSIDKFGFIHDFVYDNLVDWNHFQRDFHDKLRASIIESKADLFYLKMENDQQVPVGEVTLRYEQGVFKVTGAIEKSIPIDDIANPTITLRRDFGFIYDEHHYLFKLEHYTAAFLRIVQNKY